jgi:hypothetical protein
VLKWILPAVVFIPVFGWNLRLLTHARQQELPFSVVGDYWSSFVASSPLIPIDEHRYLMTTENFRHLQDRLFKNSEFEVLGRGIASKNFGQGGIEMFTNHRVVVMCERRELCEEFKRMSARQ